MRVADPTLNLYRTVPGLGVLDRPCSECSGVADFYYVSDRGELVFLCEGHVPAPDVPVRTCRVCNWTDADFEEWTCSPSWAPDGPGWAGPDLCGWCEASPREQAHVSLGLLVLGTFGLAVAAFAAVLLA